jgi:hypothetical protein
MAEEYSSFVSDALRGGNPYRPPTSRKRTATDAGLSQGPMPGALITPITLMPASQNPLLNDDEEEYTCLDGDERAAELYDKFMQEEDGKCVYCNHGMGKNELSKQEIEQIHSLEEENYGTMSDSAMNNWIADEYKQKLRNPVVLQRTIKARKEGKLPCLDDIPEWTPEGVAKHFEEDGLYLHRELGDDIRVTKRIQKNLQFHELAKKKKSGGKTINADKVKLWQLLSKHKSDLVTRMHLLYPHIAKRQKKTQSTGEGVKPSGTR